MRRPIQYRRIFRDSIWMYFAPLAGAIKGIRAEMRRVDREIARNRRSELETEKDTVHHA